VPGPADRKVQIDITARDRASAVLLNLTTGALAQLTAAVGSAAAAYATVKIFLIDSVRAAERAEEAEVKLANAARNAGLAAGTVLGLQERAAALQRLTGVDDEAIQSAQALLVTLGRLSGEGLDRATRAALDFADKAGGVEAAANAIARAAAGNVREFTRLGLTFDDNATRAEKLEKVLRFIEERFGGLAAARGATLEGRLHALGGAFENLQETIGSFATRNAALVGFFDQAGLALDRLRGVIESNRGSINTAIREIAVVALRSIAAIGQGMATAADQIGAAFVLISKIALPVAQFEKFLAIAEVAEKAASLGVAKAAGDQAAAAIAKPALDLALTKLQGLNLQIEVLQKLAGVDGGALGDAFRAMASAAQQTALDVETMKIDLGPVSDRVKGPAGVFDALAESADKAKLKLIEVKAELFDIGGITATFEPPPLFPDNPREVVGPVGPQIPTEGPFAGEDPAVRIERLDAAMERLRSLSEEASGAFNRFGEEALDRLNELEPGTLNVALAHERINEALKGIAETDRDAFDALAEQYLTIAAAADELAVKLKDVNDQFETQMAVGAAVVEGLSGAFDQFIAGMLQGSLDFGQILRDLVQGVAASILSTLVRIALARAIIDRIAANFERAKAAASVGIAAGTTFANAYAFFSIFPPTALALASAHTAAGTSKALALIAASAGAGEAGGAAGAGGLGRVRAQGGGFVPGFGSGDIVPAMLEPRELVLPRHIAEEIRAGRAEITRSEAGGGAGIQFNLQFNGVRAAEEYARELIPAITDLVERQGYRLVSAESLRGAR